MAICHSCAETKQSKFKINTIIFVTMLGTYGCSRMINDNRNNLSCYFQINTAEPSMDINVTGVWERGITGKNVVAVVVDDGK